MLGDDNYPAWREKLIQFSLRVGPHGILNWVGSGRPDTGAFGPFRSPRFFWIYNIYI